MKGFFVWFSKNTKMKRWILVILVGMILVCYGIAQILVAKEMSVFELVKVALLFILGFIFTILGVIFAQKRTLELLVQASDLRLEKGNKNVNLNSLIFNRKIYDKGPNIVVIGGGNGLNTVLKGLKNYTSNLTAIVTISDYGQLPTNSRRQLDLLPIEQVKESIISLSYNEQAMEEILNHKFRNGMLSGLSFGDIYLRAMKEMCGDFSKSIEASKEILNMTGKVLPVTLDEFKICAELENGMVVEEKEKIPEVVFDKVTKISRIYITPSNCLPAPGVIEAIQKADAIVIGPGSLYTNVIPNLLVKNISRTIRDSKAIKIYVSNIMTEPGQTDNFGVSDHIQAIIDHAGEGIVNYCIYDTGEIIPEYVRRYNKQGQDLVEQDIIKAKEKGVQLVQRDLSTIVDDTIRHAPEAVAEAIVQIICDDLKYRDMQTDAQYILLNSRLKESGKRRKTKPTYHRAKHSKIKSMKDEKKNSKFAEKYKDRIYSIQTSEVKRLQNLRKANNESYKNEKEDEQI